MSEQSGRQMFLQGAMGLWGGVTEKTRIVQASPTAWWVRLFLPPKAYYIAPDDIIPLGEDGRPVQAEWPCEDVELRLAIWPDGTRLFVGYGPKTDTLVWRE